MSDIEELRLRVEAAEENFGLIADQQKGYSQRLIALLNITGLKDQTIEKLDRENEQLRTMLFSLLQAIEKGDTTNTLHDMDVRISAMTKEPLEIADKTTEQPLPLPSPTEEVLSQEEEEKLPDQSPGTGDQDSSTDDLDEPVDTPTDEDGQNDLEAAFNLETTEEAQEIIADPTIESELEQESSQEEVSGSGDLSDLELSDSLTPEESEDAIIAEIAENLEQVLPSEDTQEDLSSEDFAQENPINGDHGTGPEIDESIGESESGGTTIEDALLALSKVSEEEPVDSKDPSPEEEEDEENIDIDSFLEKNKDEDKDPPASPEIEDIMERISKQALSQND